MNYDEEELSMYAKELIQERDHALELCKFALGICRSKMKVNENPSSIDKALKAIGGLYNGENA